MPPTKTHYHVQIRRNGAVYGAFGPYAKRADALADAGSMGGPGLIVDVASCSSCGAGKAPAKRRNMTHGTLRSTFLPSDILGGTRLFLSYENGRYSVHTRFQLFYRSRKISPNTDAGRRALARAENRFEEIVHSGPKPAKRRNARQNNPAVATALRLAAPYLIDAAASMGATRLKAFARLSRREQIKAIRRKYRFNLAMRTALRSDAAAGAVADALTSMVRSGAADKALAEVTSAAKKRTKTNRKRRNASLPPALARKGTRRLR